MIEADGWAAAYQAHSTGQPVFPNAFARAALSRFDEPLTETGLGDLATLALLDEVGSPGTVVSNGPNYFGFIIGASLPAAAAAQRLMIAPVEPQGRVDPAQLPALDARTILALRRVR